MLSLEEIETLRYYEQHAEEWASKRKSTNEPSFWHAEYLELQALRKPSGKVLEIGSGSGREALELAAMGYEYVGIDLSQELLKIARKTHPNGVFLQSSPYALPFDTSFDAIFSWALLPHLSKKRIAAALIEARRVLKPDGIAFFAMREGCGEAKEVETGRWFSYYSLEEFEAFLHESGFRVLQKNKKPSRANLTWLTFFCN